MVQEHPTLLSKTPEAPRFDTAAKRPDGEPPLLMAVNHLRCSLWQLGAAQTPEVSSFEQLYIPCEAEP